MTTAAEQDAALKATANEFNKGGEATGSEAENEARAAAAALEAATGNVNHEGNTEVRADTAEELAAIEAKKAEEAAKAKAEADKAAEEAKTPEQKAEEAAAQEAVRKQVAEETNAAGWMQTDDPSLQASLNLMKAAGLSPAEAGEFFNDALDTGDLGTVDQEALKARVGADNSELIMAGVTKYSADQSAEVLAKVNNIQETVGGKENWADMVKWSKAAARADEAVKSELTELQTMMNGSETQGKLAAQRMMEMYNADAKNTTIRIPSAATVNTPVPTMAAPAARSVDPISAQVYAEKIQALTSRGAQRQADMAALSKARAAGRSAGF
jgi:hypothetical protein